MPKYANNEEYVPRKNQNKIDEKSIGKMIENTGKLVENIQEYRKTNAPVKKQQVNIEKTNSLNPKTQNIEKTNSLNAKAPNAKVRQ
jgi:polyribonucleotide nucleotidyltransferase